MTSTTLLCTLVKNATFCFRIAALRVSTNSRVRKDKHSLFT